MEKILNRISINIKIFVKILEILLIWLNVLLIIDLVNLIKIIQKILRKFKFLSIKNMSIKI